MKLTVIPILKPAESAISFTLRLFEKHGLRKVSHVLTQPQIRRITKGLVTGLKSLDRALPKKVFSTSIISPLFKHANMLEPKVCVRCLIESGIHQNCWHNPFLAQCPIHQDFLIDSCQECHEFLTWDIALLTGHCTNEQCNAKLKAHSEKLAALSEKQVADCLLAFHLSTNFVSILKATNYPQLKDYPYRVSKGYELLSSRSNAKKWITSILEDSSCYIPSDFALTTVYQLAAHLYNKWPSKEVLISARDQPYRHHSREIGSLKVAVATARNLLQTTTEELEKLCEHRLINKSTASKINYRSEIDISPIFRLLSEHEVTQGMASLISQIRTLEFNDVSIADILISIDNKKLALGYKANKSLLDSIYFCPIEFKAFANHIFSQRQYDYIEINKALKITGSSLDELMQLRKQGLMKRPKWVRNDAEQFVQFIDVLQLRQKRLEQTEFQFDD